MFWKILLCFKKDCCVLENFVVFSKRLLCFRREIELCFAPVGHRSTASETRARATITSRVYSRRGGGYHSHWPVSLVINIKRARFCLVITRISENVRVTCENSRPFFEDFRTCLVVTPQGIQLHVSGVNFGKKRPTCNKLIVTLSESSYF